MLQRGYGAVVTRPRETAERLAAAFSHEARQWDGWRTNLVRDSRPDGAFRIAELALHEPDGAVLRGGGPPSSPIEITSWKQGWTSGPSVERSSGGLLCDFHIHTNYSDGKLTLAEVVDYYGAHRFDCICITDHLADPRRIIGRLSRLSGLTLPPAQLDEYFQVIRREADRAWRRCRMLVMAGIEFNKDGFTRKSSAHLLGIGLRHPIAPDLDLPETIAAIHAQDALAVASHPHVMKSEWGKNTLYLWENQETFAPLLDAWEIANRDNLFSPVALKRFPFIANSDFHKPRHIYSWKTLLHCDKEPEAIKACIRDNRNVSITLYRRPDHKASLAPGTGLVRETPEVADILPPEPLPVGEVAAVASAATTRSQVSWRETLGSAGPDTAGHVVERAKAVMAG